MKTTWISLFSILLLACLVGCQDPKPPIRCTGKVTCKGECWNDKEKQAGEKTCEATTDYVCGDLIFTYDAGADPGWVKSTQDALKKKGFVMVDSCPCSVRMELWQLPKALQQSVDLIGVITGSNDPGKEVGGEGLSLNFTLKLDTSQYKDLPNDTFPLETYPIDPTKPEVVVATIDSGVDPASKYLQNNLWNNPARDAICQPWKDGIFGLEIVAPLAGSEPMDVSSHGTMVNGVLLGMGLLTPIPAAEQVGVPLRLMNVKFIEDGTHSGSIFKAVCGMYYAMDHDARVLNLSWGFLHEKQPLVVINALEVAKKKGVVIVAGLGNDGMNLASAGLRFWPAGFAETWDNVIAVGALNKNQTALAGFSNRANASLMTLVAPGEEITSSDLTSPNGLLAIAQNSGTSFAAPYVSRAAALMWGKRPDSPAAIKAHLIAHSTNVTSGAGAPYLKLDRPAALAAW